MSIAIKHQYTQKLTPNLPLLNAEARQFLSRAHKKLGIGLGGNEVAMSRLEPILHIVCRRQSDTHAV